MPSSLTENEYKPRFFDEPDCLSLDKENIPPTKSFFENLSLVEGINDAVNEATSWDASVARNVIMTPRACSPFPKQTSTLEDLEPDTDDDIIDVTDYSERPANDRSPWLKQTSTTCTVHKDTAPHLKTAPHIYPWMQQQQHLPSLTEWRSRESSWTREDYPVDDPLV